jgi:hypothetical protein
LPPATGSRLRTRRATTTPASTFAARWWSFAASLPRGINEEQERRFGDLHYKAFNAREHGAVGLLVVDLPEVAAGKTAPDEAPLPALRVDTLGDGGLPIAVLTRAAGAALFSGAHRAEVVVDLVRSSTSGVQHRRSNQGGRGRSPAGSGGDRSALRPPGSRRARPRSLRE